ncbi:MAG: DUF4157 domain-containing protein [Bacteroidia bacterium]|nr:DUF4157 domain-containing protein [Bacteroidia bacterium]
MKRQLKKNNSPSLQRREKQFQKQGGGDFFPANKSIQPKLKVGEPGDKYEQEADAMADQVVNQPAHTAPQISPMMDGEDEAKRKPMVQQMAAEEKIDKMDDPEVMEKQEEEQVDMKEREEGLDMKEEEQVDMKEKEKGLDMKEEEIQEKPSVQRSTQGSGTGHAPSTVESSINSSKGQGHSLSAHTQSQMESAFGADFSGVRVHTDSRSIQMNQELGAQAFTHGSDVYFNEGKYSPETSKGKHLLAHELTHVVQQGGSELSRKKNPEIQSKPSISKGNNKSIQRSIETYKMKGLGDNDYSWARNNDSNIKLISSAKRYERENAEYQKKDTAVLNSNKPSLMKIPHGGKGRLNVDLFYILLEDYAGLWGDNYLSHGKYTFKLDYLAKDGEIDYLSTGDVDMEKRESNNENNNAASVRVNLLENPSIKGVKVIVKVDTPRRNISITDKTTTNSDFSIGGKLDGSVGGSLGANFKLSFDFDPTAEIGGNIGADVDVSASISDLLSIIPLLKTASIAKKAVSWLKKARRIVEKVKPLAKALEMLDLIGIDASLKAGLKAAVKLGLDIKLRARLQAALDASLNVSANAGGNIGGGYSTKNTNTREESYDLTKGGAVLSKSYEIGLEEQEKSFNPAAYRNDILFEKENQENLSPEGKQRLGMWWNNIPQEVQQKVLSGELTVFLDGHTSMTGTDRYNSELGEKRAQNVREALLLMYYANTVRIDFERIKVSPRSSGETAARGPARDSIFDRRVKISLEL